MQVVIEIDEKTYKDIKEENSIYGINNGLSVRITGKVVGAIQNGEPLPKGHGRLVDIDLLRDQVSHDEREAFSKHQVWLLLSTHNKKIPTIIEADKEQK